MKSLFGGSIAGSSGSSSQTTTPSTSNSATTISTSRNRMRTLSKSSGDLSRLARNSSFNDDPNYLSYRQAAANKQSAISNQTSVGIGGMPSTSSHSSHSHSHSQKQLDNESNPSNNLASNGLVTSLKSKGKRAIQRFEDSINNQSQSQSTPLNQARRFSTGKDRNSYHDSTLGPSDLGTTSPDPLSGVGVVRRGSTGSTLLLSSPNRKEIDPFQDWPDRTRGSSSRAADSELTLCV